MLVVAVAVPVHEPGLVTVTEYEPPILTIACAALDVKPFGPDQA